MRRLAVGLLVAIAALVALPPLYYRVFPLPPSELPPAGRRIEVAPGVAVNAIERGDGSPAVLIHGLPGCAYDWTPLSEALAARGLRVLAYDRVGFGRSDGPTTTSASKPTRASCSPCSGPKTSGR